MARTRFLRVCLLSAVLAASCRGAFAEGRTPDDRPAWLDIIQAGTTQFASATRTDEVPPPPPLDPTQVKSQGVSDPDARGNRWFARAGYTYIFDYWFDNPGLDGSDYSVSGHMYSLGIGSYGKGGWGWSLQYSYAPPFSFSARQASTNAKVDVEMERHDAELIVFLPVTTERDWGRAGLTAGWKFTYVEKELDWNKTHWYEEQTLWTGPMLGGYVNIPLSKNKKLSWFAMGNAMVLYTEQDHKNPWSSTPSYTWSTIGYGLNGSTGIRWTMFDNNKVGVDIEGGYRGQVLTTMEDFGQADMYQGVFANLQIRF